MIYEINLLKAEREKYFLKIRRLVEEYMKRIMYGGLLFFALASLQLQAYTFRICYNGSDSPEVDAPDSITVSSVIHGGSACWVKSFAVTVKKGEFKDIVINPAERNDPAWNCHVVPETVNGETVHSTTGSWPLRHLSGPSLEAIGETWQIRKTTPIIQKSLFQLPRGIKRAQTSISINWLAEIQDGLQECESFETAVKTLKTTMLSSMAAPTTGVQQEEAASTLLSSASGESAASVAQILSQNTIAPYEYGNQESWLDWTKRWGSRIGIMALLYALARQMPGSTIRSFEGSLGNLGRSARDYLRGYLTPTWGDLDIGLTDQDIMGGQGMIGFEMPQDQLPGAASVAMPGVQMPEEAPFRYEFQAQPRQRISHEEQPGIEVKSHGPARASVDLPAIFESAGSYEFNPKEPHKESQLPVLPEPRLEVPRELPPLTIIQPVQEPVVVPQKKAGFRRVPIKQIRQAPGVWTNEYLANPPRNYVPRQASSSALESGSSSSVSTLSIPTHAHSSSLSLSVPPSPMAGGSTTLSMASAPGTPVHARGNQPTHHRSLSQREQQAILAHIRRATGTPQSPQAQAWVSKVPH